MAVIRNMAIVSVLRLEVNHMSDLNIEGEIDEILTKQLFKSSKFRNKFSSGTAYRFNHNTADVTKAVAEAKQALIELVAKAYERGRKAGVAENQFETINRLRKSQGKSPITLAELSSNKQGG